jgi:hypothetical protein
MIAIVVVVLARLDFSQIVRQTHSLTCRSWQVFMQIARVKLLYKKN